MRPFLYILILFACNVLHAQQVTLSFSGEKGYKGSRQITAFGADLYDLDFSFNIRNIKMFKNNNSYLRISKYDNHINLIAERKLFNSEKAVGPFDPFLKKINDNLVLVYSTIDRDEGKIRIMMSKVDTKSLVLANPIETIVVMLPKYTAITGGDIFNTYQLDICQSANNQNTAVIYNSGQENELYFSVLDADLKISRREMLPIQGIRKLVVQHSSVDNEMNFYATCNGETAIVFPSKSSAKTIKIGPGSDALLKQAFIFPSEKNKTARIVGLYGDKKTSMKGCYIQSLDAAYNIVDVKVHEFPDSVKRKYSETLNDFEFTNYYVRKYPPVALKFSDERIVLLCQAVRSETRPIYSGGLVGTTYFGAILHIRIDDEKGIHLTEIQKQEFPLNSTTPVWRYIAFVNNSRIVVFYHDLTMSESNNELKSKAVKRNLVLFAAVVKVDGTLTRQAIESLDKPEFDFLVGGIQPVSSNEFFIPVIKEKQKFSMEGYKYVSEKLINGTLEIH